MKSVNDLLDMWMDCHDKDFSQDSQYKFLWRVEADKIIRGVIGKRWTPGDVRSVVEGEKDLSFVLEKLVALEKERQGVQTCHSCGLAVSRNGSCGCS
jgi:hypothetical protein